MKKMLCLFATAALLAGCGGESAKNGEAQVKTDKGVITAKVTVEGDKITSVTLDETTEKDGKEVSKKELKEDYNMIKASAIQKEWYQQVEALEEYIVQNGVDSIKVDEEGKPENEDILTSCTISVDKLLEAVKEAKANAK